MTRWPTLVLATAALTGQAAVAWGLASGHVGPLGGVLLASACAWVAFTPVHEAAHHHLGRLDALIGHAAVTPLLGALGPYRFLHARHHAFADDPVRDPDAWTTARTNPLAWLTADVGYVLFYLRCWHDRPAAERAELLLRGLLYAAALPLAWRLGPDVLRAVVFASFVPARLVLAAQIGRAHV